MLSIKVIYYLLYLSVIFYLPANGSFGKDTFFRINRINPVNPINPIRSIGTKASTLVLTPDCPSTYFNCGDGTCVSFLFLCDGVADCANSSDENCNGTVHKQKNLNCEEGKFSCPGIDICLPNKWKCDGHRDCPNGFDESNCTSTAVCEGFKCKTGECIPAKWKCDNNSDCADGSDEEICKSSRIDPNCIRENGKFECASGRCISHEKVCDGHNDCPAGDDEGKFCDIDGCHAKNCTHGCFQTPQGAQCDCNNGFKLADDKRTCVDIDECADSFGNICSHKCINTKGSFKCECEKGFKLVNKTRCEVQSAEPVLIYTDSHSVRGYWLNKKLHFLIARGLSNAMGVDMHRESKLVFWTDIGQNASYVFSAHFNNKNVRAIVTSGLLQPEDIAVDYVGNNLYITDAGLKQIIVCKIDGSSCAPIVKRGIDSIRAIALDVQHGRMFWTDWGEKPGIYTARMDGSGIRALVNRNIIWPNGLTYDKYKNRIYWSDAKLERIEYYDLTTSKRYVLIDDAVYHPHCLTMFEDSLYWADWDVYSISKSNKFTGHNMTAIFRRPNKVYGMHIYHPVHYDSSINPCWSASCSHLCLINSPIEFKCACPNHMTLDPKDRTTCIEKHEHDYLLIGLDTDVKRIYPKNIGKDITKKLISKLPKEIDYINDYAFSHAHNELYLYNVNRPGLLKIVLSSGEQSSIFNDKNLSSVFALTYDAFSHNLYWLDLEKNELVVGSVDGEKKITLINNLHAPSSLTLYQERNELFIGQMGNHPQIIVTDLNGKNSKTLISNIGYPTSLAIHKETNQLYWSDAKKGTIESISLNDTTSKTIVLTNLGQVESLVIKGHTLYWTNMNTNYIYMMNLEDKTKNIMIASVGDSKVTKKLIRVSMDDVIKNDCLTIKNKCDHICLFDGFKMINNAKVPLTQCLCLSNSSLAEDKRTCEAKQHCATGMFTCRSTKQCIRQSEVCDGHKNCDNNEDEIGCPEIKPCNTYESRCDPNDLKSSCIPNSWFCDGEKDCDNGFDELTSNCNHNQTGKSIYNDVAHKSTVNDKCEAGYFKCDQNVCIPWHFVCNGEVNCADKTDEGPNCLTKCSCKNNGKCYLDHTDNTWACQCSAEFEGRECEFRKDLSARSDEHQIVMKESIYQKGRLSSEEDSFDSTVSDAGAFWLIMLIVVIVLMVVGVVLFGYMYMYETNERMYMVRRNLNRKFNFRNKSSSRKNYDFNSATADLLDRMECERDDEDLTQCKDHDKFAC